MYNNHNCAVPSRGQYMYKLAVLGNPIEHSLSPLVFTLFAKQFGLELIYDKVLATNEADFKSQIKTLFADGYIGVNVTSPFKNAAYNCTPYHTIRSQFCCTANFLYIDKDCKLISDTTDGIGILTDIKNNKKIDLKDKKILFIGSGYVVDSILLDFIVENPNCIDILARNQKRVDYLQYKFCIGDFSSNKYYDLIINTSPNRSDNQLFDQIKHVDINTFCYDLSYHRGIFLDKCSMLNQYAVTYSGIGMLVEQAAVAFKFLFGHTPDTNIVIQELLNRGYNG